MIQNIIALIMVFAAAGYTVWATIRSLKSKKICNCDECSGCELKSLIKNSGVQTLKTK
jgi:hypothetical protein